MRINKEVQLALIQKKAVVALESTIISHGMPFPDNVNTALMLEKIIKDQGAVPATIGIVEGEIVVGLTAEEINELGTRTDVVKVSQRDLPIVLANKQWGATTVATTMFIAQKANIEVFVTGGIGGVHRNAQETFDVSSDLIALKEFDVTVVCAGAKSILDIPLTLEMLETYGVSVVGYQSDELAAFYSRSSGYKIDAKAESVQQLAQIVISKRQLGLGGGIVISNPIPVEHEIAKNEMDQIIEDAIIQSQKLNIKGKDVTPFLLAWIKERTQGRSLKANIELIKHNAIVGSQLAIAIANGSV